jgi:hypothetical protein
MNDLYFQYGVQSSVNVETPSNISFDAMTICTRYIDVMDYKLINHHLNSSFRYSLDDEEIRDLQNSISLTQIFDWTPDTDHVIGKGWHRTPKSYLLKECKGTECTKTEFDVEKFYYLEYICYKISTKESIAMSQSAISETSVSAGLLFRIEFAKLMSNSLRIVITLHGPSVLPYRSVTITPVIVRGGTKERLAGKQEQFSRFVSYQRRMSVDNLPAPYKSNCFDYTKIGFHSDLACIRSCVINRTIAGVNRLPFSVILTEGMGDLHVLSYRDTLNKEMMQKVIAIEKDCAEVQCKWSPCQLRLSLTVTRMRSNAVFESDLVAPVKPSFTVKFRPKMDLTEYFVYLMSIFTTWSGLHMIQMDPFLLVEKRVGSKKRQESAYMKKLLKDEEVFHHLIALSMRLQWMEKRMVRIMRNQGLGWTRHR